MTDKGKTSAKLAEKPTQADTSKKAPSTQTMHASARKIAAHTDKPVRESTSKRAETSQQHEKNKLSASKMRENTRRLVTSTIGKETNRNYFHISSVKDKKSSNVYTNHDLINKGQQFHRDERNKLDPKQKEYSEVQVKMKGKKGRIDIYKPRVGPKGEVIENKYTQLGKISNTTFYKYIQQVKGYVGREICSRKYPILNGERIDNDAQPVLMVPRQSYRNAKERNIANQRRRDAHKRGVQIRESNGTSL